MGIKCKQNVQVWSGYHKVIYSVSYWTSISAIIFSLTVFLSLIWVPLFKISHFIHPLCEVNGIGHVHNLDGFKLTYVITYLFNPLKMKRICFI
jgi:hypothetical protein